MNSLEKLIPKQIERNKKMMEMIMESKKIQKHYENKTNDIKKILKNLDKNIKKVESFRHPNDIEDRKFKEIGLFFEEKYWNVFKDTLDCITNLEKENEKLKEQNKMTDEQIEKTLEVVSEHIYKSRNEKAIEYIKERTFDEVSIAPFVDDFNCKENLLNILQGEDKDVKH